MEQVAVAMIVVFIGCVLGAIGFIVSFLIKWQYKRNAAYNEYIDRKVDKLHGSIKNSVGRG